MLRNAGFTAIHVVLIAVSIGLTCSAFIVLDAVLLRSLPAISSPDQLVMIGGARDSNERVDGQPLRIFDHLRNLREGTSHIFAYRNYGALPTTIGTTTKPMRGMGVVGDYFDGLGRVPLAMGRAFDPNSDEPVVLIGYWVWREQFGGASDVLGQTMTVGTTSLTVVGVAREDFVGTQPDLRWDFLTPLRVLDRARGISPAAALDQAVYAIARLKPNVRPEQYEASIAAEWPSILRATVPPKETLERWTERRGRRVVVNPFRTGQAFTLITTPGLSRALTLTAGLSILIFLASCVTLALLVVARAVKNQRHAAIRVALGGGGWRIVRPQLIEAALISLVGCVAGLFMAVWGIELGRSFVPGDWPMALNSVGIAVAVAMAVATTILSGSLTAYFASRSSVRDALQSADRGSRPYVRLRVALLVTQFAVAVVLVHSTLLYVDDLAGLTRVETGIDVENLHVYALTGRLPQRMVAREYFERLESELKAIPGARSIGLSGGSPPLAFIRDLTEPVQTDDERKINASTTCVFPGAFASWGSRQLAGRDLDWTDGPSVVVTEMLARKLYPNQNPIGRTVRLGGPGTTPRDHQVVGIVANMAFNGPRLGLRDVVFVPCLERTNPWPSNFVVQVFIRSERNLAELAADVNRIVDRLGVHYVYSMDDQEQYVAWAIEREEMLATLSTAFGGLILLMTGVGLYAFCNYMLAFRRRELAIRAGLGAAPRDIATALLRESFVVLAAGIGVGLAATMALSRLMSGFVVDVGSVTIAKGVQTVFVVAAVAAIATWVPTLRALRIDVARALRVD